MEDFFFLTDSAATTASTKRSGHILQKNLQLLTKLINFNLLSVKKIYTVHVYINQHSYK